MNQVCLAQHSISIRHCLSLLSGRSMTFLQLYNIIKFRVVTGQNKQHILSVRGQMGQTSTEMFSKYFTTKPVFVQQFQLTKQLNLLFILSSVVNLNLSNSYVFQIVVCQICVFQIAYIFSLIAITCRRAQ